LKGKVIQVCHLGLFAQWFGRSVKEVRNLSIMHGRSLAGNGWRLCVRLGFPALKPINSTNFKLSTNDYR